MAIRFKEDPMFRTKWAKTPEAQRMLKTAAGEIAAAAKTFTAASIGDGIDTIIGEDEGQFIARVNANDFRSNWFEFGTVKMSARPFMSNGAIAAGYRLEGRRK